ncbi:MAG TPA: terminase family protein [Candidatus Limnocylindria bacterium]|jgi:phage FluMu gp28-like protein|nr:terminase family protein [Candidatus Limnocylindria bacterium]
MISPPPGFIGRCKIFPERDALMIGYQRKWIEDNSIKKLMEKGRQIGITWGTAYRVVATTSLADARYDDWVSSRDELQAKLFVDDCKSFANILHIGAQALGKQVIDEEKNSAYVLNYANGRTTYSLSSNPDAQAGKRGRRVLDEFALHPDPRKLYSIAGPGITWGGSMEIISTHRGTANFFNELIQEIKHKGNPKQFSLHTVTLQTALDHGFLYKLQSKLSPEDPRQEMDETDYFNFVRSGCADEETFLQEYMCIPGDDASAFLSYDLIASAEYAVGEKWELTPGELAKAKGDLYIGVDIGRVHDLTVIWVFEKLGGVFYTRAIVEMKNAEFDFQEHALYEFLALPNMRRCCIDHTGIGRQFAERAIKRFGNYRVEAITFTPAVKEELAYPVKAACEDRTVKIPNRPEIRSDWRAIRKETTASNNIRFTGERGKNGHSDRFWSASLGLHAGKNFGVSFGAEVI